MTETLANGYSSESTQRELSNEYQQDRVWMVFKNLCVLVLWTEVASASEELTFNEIVRKYLKDSLSELYTSLLQKFCKFMLHSKVIFKSVTGLHENSWRIFEGEMFTRPLYNSTDPADVSVLSFRSLRQ